MIAILHTISHLGDFRNYIYIYIFMQGWKWACPHDTGPTGMIFEPWPPSKENR